MAKLVLNMDAVHDDFFADTALLGVGTAIAGHRFCWSVNQYLGYQFRRTPDEDILYKKNKNTPEQNFPVYTYTLPHSGCKHIIYKLKMNKANLLPELKELDYLWLIQSQTADNQAENLYKQLKNVPDILLTQILSPEKLKSINHLLL